MKFLLLGLVQICIQTILSVRIRKGDKDEDSEPLKEGPMSIKQSQRKMMDGDSGITFYSFIEIYKNHKLTLGEIKHVFTTADMNRDNQVDASEWKMFYKLFVKPFERCDADLDYTIDSKEMEKCFESKYLNSTKLTKDDVPEVINSLDRNNKTNLTFVDYIFLRRVNLAWKECTTDFQLSVAKLDCALEITVPGRRVDLPEAD